MNVEIDRDKAAALGVTANQIENAFYDAYGPRWVSTIYAPVNEYKVLLELAPQFQADPRALSLLYFKATPTPADDGRSAAGGAQRQRRRHADDVGAGHGRAARHAGARRRTSVRRRSTTTASCRRSRSRSASRRARRSATS